MNTNSAVQRQPSREQLEQRGIEYVPFGGTERLKLTVAIVKNQIAVKTKSGRTCSDSDAIKFMMMCQARALNPWEGDAYLVGYDSNVNGTIVPTYSLITAHQAFLKRAEVHPEYEGMQSGILLLDEDSGEVSEREGDFHLEDELVVGGWAKVYVKGKRFPTYRKIRMKRFNTGFAQWKVDPAGMIVKCAEADALRSSFPTKVGGMYLREEIDLLPADINISPSITGMIATSVAEEPKIAEGQAGAVRNEEAGSQAQNEKAAEPAQESNQAEPQQQSGRRTRRPEAAPAQSARAELSQFVVTEGFSFNELQRWAVETDSIRGADSFATFDDIPEADAQRLLRNKAGLITQLRNIKGS